MDIQAIRIQHMLDIGSHAACACAKLSKSKISRELPGLHLGYSKCVALKIFPKCSCDKLRWNHRKSYNLCIS